MNALDIFQEDEVLFPTLEDKEQDLIEHNGVHVLK